MVVGISNRFGKWLVGTLLLGLTGGSVHAADGGAEGIVGVTVGWRANTESDLAGYYIYYGPRSRVYTNRIRVDATATAARIEPLVPLGTYYLAIAAFNTADVESLPSAELVYRATGPPNDPPTITPIPDQLMSEDVPSRPIPFIISDPQTAPALLTLKAHSSNTNLIRDNYLLFGGTGAQRTLVIVPQLEQSGTAQITVEVHDPVGASNKVTFNVEVAPVNDDPVISPIANQTINEDTASARLQFYVFDAESPPDALWVLALSSNPLLIPPENITITGSGNSRYLTFRPSKDASGSGVIDVYAIDPQGGPAWSEFNVVVLPVNDPPTLSAVPTVTVDEDSSSVAVPIAVSDIDSPLADIRLSASASDPSLIGPEGFVFGGSEGARTMVITPKPDQFGTNLVRLVATDSGGGSATNTFVLIVRPVNDPPSIDQIPNFSMDTGSGPLSVALTGINSGRTNESDTLEVSAFSSNPAIIPDPEVTYASPGKTGSLSLAPLPSTNGEAVITVIVNDGRATNSQSFTVSVPEINDPPVIYALPELAVMRPATPLEINFEVQDPDTPTDKLVVTCYSSDARLLPRGTIIAKGNGTRRSLKVKPIVGRSGLTIITIVASDGSTVTTASFYLLVRGGGP